MTHTKYQPALSASLGKLKSEISHILKSATLLKAIAMILHPHLQLFGYIFYKVWRLFCIRDFDRCLSFFNGFILFELSHYWEFIAFSMHRPMQQKSLLLLKLE